MIDPTEFKWESPCVDGLDHELDYESIYATNDWDSLQCVHCNAKRVVPEQHAYLVSEDGYGFSTVYAADLEQALIKVKALQIKLYLEPRVDSIVHWRSCPCGKGKGELWGEYSPSCEDQE